MLKSNDQSLISFHSSLFFCAHMNNSQGLLTVYKQGDLGWGCSCSFWMVCSLTLSQLMFLKLNTSLCVCYVGSSNLGLTVFRHIFPNVTLYNKDQDKHLLLKRFIKHDKLKWSEKETKWKGMLSINVTFCYAQHSNAICSLIFFYWVDFICWESWG